MGMLIHNRHSVNSGKLTTSKQVEITSKPVENVEPEVKKSVFKKSDKKAKED